MSICPSWPCRDADHLLVSAGVMAELEGQLFASGLPVEALMEKAALAMARQLLGWLQAGPGSDPWSLSRHWPAAAGVQVLVGPGHNGGDGLVIARELHLAGIPVRLWLPFERLRPLTEAHLRHARWLGIPCLERPPDPGEACLWIDALFGTGQNRPPGERLETLLEERQRQRPAALVAVDGPTGLCADSGKLLGSGGATAALTWSLGLLRRGLLQDPAIARVGRLELVPLGLPQRLLADLPASTPLVLNGADVATAPWPQPDPAASKYGRGRLLVVAGSARYPGAASLALAAAGASGCGSLRAALPLPMADQLWLRHPQVVLDTVLPCGERGELRMPAGLAIERLDAVLLGPGLGLAEPATSGEASPAPGAAWAEETSLWERLLAFEGLLLLDADGLNRLAIRPGAGAAPWLRQRRGPTWITPHRGEFRRLFPSLAELDPLQAAAAAAAESGASVLLKGARTVVASPDGRCWQLRRAAAEAARAGLGDTLAGYAAGRGAMAMAAATGHGDACLLAAAALEHAEAGLRCLRRLGAGGVTPMAVCTALASMGSPQDLDSTREKS